MEVHIRVQVHSGIEEHLQGRKSRLMNRKPFVGDDGVVNQSGQIDRTNCDAAHVGIAQHIIQVVGRIAARDYRLQHIEPARLP